MDSRAMEAFLKRLLEIVNNITILSSSSDWHDLTDHTYVSISEGITLINDNITRFDKLFELIWDKLRHDGKFTRESIKKGLKQLVVRIVKEGNTNNASAYFNEFIEYYETYSFEQIFYIPLVNIEMQDIDKLEIGKVTIKKMTDKQIEIISRKIKKIIMQTTHPREHKPLMIDTLLRRHIEPLRGKICAEFRIIAEPELVQEYARKEISRIIDLLRYAIPSIYPYQYPAYWCSPEARKIHKQSEKEGSTVKHTRIGFGLQGEIGIGILNTITLSSKGEEFHMQGSFIGLRPFVISPDNITIMKKIGVFKVARLLKKSEVTSFGEVILRSIHWYANALTQVEIENELLSLVTSLETILTGSEDRMMDAVGYGVAFLLGTNLDHRLDLMARYKDIYGKRSRASHHGHRDVDQVDLVELRYLTLETIQKAIKNLNKWKEHEQLLEWIRRRKLT